MNYLDKAKDIYNMLATGKLFEAFHKYYHNDVEVVEANGESRKGKDKNRSIRKSLWV